jgi:lysophospholipase L1-like esterase
MRPPRFLLSVVAFSALALTPFRLVAQAPIAEQSASLATPAIVRDEAGVVKLTCATAGATIRYSLDGSDPGPKAGPYLAPIELTAGGVVKARAFTEDRKEKSELAMASFEPRPGAGPMPTTLAPCTQDRDWPIYDWARRHAAVSALVKEHKPALIFLGDSITQMFGGEPHGRGQPGQEVWEKYYGKRNTANLGFGYDYVENTLWRLQHGELDGAAAKAVVVLIGTNNIGKNTPEEIADGVSAICAEVHRQQPAARIVLLGVFPRGHLPDATRAKIEAINKLLASFEGSKEAVTFLDIGAKFLEPDGSISKETMGDYLHPTAKGFEIWARELEPLLSKLLGE